MLLRCVHASGSECNLYVNAGILRGLFNRSRAAENDQVGERDLLAGFLLDRLELRKHRLQLGRLVHLPVLLGRETNARAVGATALVGSRGMSRPMAQAVETSWETVRPDARIFVFNAAMSASLIGG